MVVTVHGRGRAGPLSGPGVIQCTSPSPPASWGWGPDIPEAERSTDRGHRCLGHSPWDVNIKKQQQDYLAKI